MPRFKLMNILLETTPQFYQAPGLYCASNNAILRDEHGDWVLLGPGTFDFTTFFNAVSVQKWRRYTVAHAFHLHLELKGAACFYVQTRADTYTWYSEKLPETKRDLPASDEWTSYEFDIQTQDADIMDGFILSSDGDVRIRNSYYFTDVDDSALRPVELALCTTTFKKEHYITHNIDLVEKSIMGSDEAIADHITMHVVDNGRTLDAEGLSRGRIHVYPNQNVGGSGGFARGMIQALEQTPKATHVLLMDDDVYISPESIIRTYNLLSIVNDEYRDSFISGAMMNMDEPEARHEDIGFMHTSGTCRAAKMWGRMNVLHDAIVNEAFRIPYGEHDFKDMATQHYAAWWYCVIPTTAIEENGMPLPLFVRMDDAEYGLRCKPKHFMTMNGICIWHSPFAMRYSAAAERYQAVRNSLIAQFTTGFAPMSDFVDNFYHIVSLELKKFNYADAELALDGFEDFLKGPDFIATKGQSEASFLAASKNAEKLEPLEQVKEEARELGVDLDELTSLDITRDPSRTRQEAFIDYLTFNGQRFGEGERGVAVIDAAGGAYPAGRIRGKDVIIAIDIPNHKGAIRRKDKKRFHQVWSRYKADMKQFKASESKLREAYGAAREKLTSVAFWKDYLGIS